MINGILGAMTGAFVAWLLVGAFTDGPTYPADTHGGCGPGCLTTLVAVIIGAAVGAMVGSLLG